MTNEESGDGDGLFYLPGGKIVPKKILEKSMKFSENVKKEIKKKHYS